MKILEKDNDLMLFGLDKSQRSNKGAFAFIFVYLFATVFGAVLTPLLYWLTQYVSEIFPQNELLLYLLDKGVDKYFDRLRWAGVLIALPYLFKYCGLTSIKSLGLSFSQLAKKNFIKYFALGICTMLFIYTMQIAFTDMALKDLSIASFLKLIIGAALGGLILGILEEVIFRGLIFRSFYTAWGVLPAVLLSSLFFAYKHFKVPDSIWASVDLHSAHWYTGFTMAFYDGVGIFMSFRALEFFSLLVLAMFLCVLYLRTKSLYSTIAFHCAVVFALKIHRGFFIAKPDDLRIFFGNSGVTNSYISLLILSIFLIFALFKTTKNRGI